MIRIKHENWDVYFRFDALWTLWNRSQNFISVSFDLKSQCLILSVLQLLSTIIFKLLFQSFCKISGKRVCRAIRIIHHSMDWHSTTKALALTLWRSLAVMTLTLILRSELKTSRWTITGTLWDQLKIHVRLVLLEKLLLLIFVIL